MSSAPEQEQIDPFLFTEHLANTILLKAHRKFSKVLKLLALGKDDQYTLLRLTTIIEQLLPGRIATVMLTDQASHQLFPVTMGSTLPEEYLEKISRTSISPTSGSCGAAAYYKKPFVVSDTLRHPNWENMRKLNIKHDLRACWSIPMLATDEAVLGTFAVYSHEVSAPGRTELEILETAAHVASVMLEKKRTEERLNTDQLTGVYNRSFFFDSATNYIAMAGREDKKAALMFIDLDNFKLINDQLGHAMGDRVLIETSHALRSALRSYDLFCRYGGDEFLALTLGVSQQDVTCLCDRMINRISEVCLDDLDGIALGASIGVTVFDPRNPILSLSDIIKESDQLMYRAKSSGIDYEMGEVPA